MAEPGGLYVLATEDHEARRIDRQLFGRCGRQGDPGSYVMLVALDDTTNCAPRTPAVSGAGSAPWRPPALLACLGPLAVRRAQSRAERLHRRMRRDLLRLDEHLETALAFAGRHE